jgi:hypothetical protein
LLAIAPASEHFRDNTELLHIMAELACETAVTGGWRQVMTHHRACLLGQAVVEEALVSRLASKLQCALALARPALSVQLQVSLQSDGALGLRSQGLLAVPLHAVCGKKGTGCWQQRSSAWGQVLR